MTGAAATGAGGRQSSAVVSCLSIDLSHAASALASAGAHSEAADRDAHAQVGSWTGLGSRSSQTTGLLSDAAAWMRKRVGMFGGDAGAAGALLQRLRVILAFSNGSVMPVWWGVAAAAVPPPIPTTSDLRAAPGPALPGLLRFAVRQSGVHDWRVVVCPVPRSSGTSVGASQSVLRRAALLLAQRSPVAPGSGARLEASQPQVVDVDAAIAGVDMSESSSGAREETKVWLLAEAWDVIASLIREQGQVDATSAVQRVAVELSGCDAIFNPLAPALHPSAFRAHSSSDQDACFYAAASLAASLEASQLGLPALTVQTDMCRAVQNALAARGNLSSADASDAHMHDTLELWASLRVALPRLTADPLDISKRAPITHLLPAVGRRHRLRVVPRRGDAAAVVELTTAGISIMVEACSLEPPDSVGSHVISALTTSLSGTPLACVRVHGTIASLSAKRSSELAHVTNGSKFGADYSSLAASLLDPRSAEHKEDLPSSPATYTILLDFASDHEADQFLGAVTRSGDITAVGLPATEETLVPVIQARCSAARDVIAQRFDRVAGVVFDALWYSMDQDSLQRGSTWERACAQIVSCVEAHPQSSTIIVALANPAGSVISMCPVAGACVMTPPEGAITAAARISRSILDKGTSLSSSAELAAFMARGDAWEVLEPELATDPHDFMQPVLVAARRTLLGIRDERSPLRSSATAVLGMDGRRVDAQPSPVEGLLSVWFEILRHEARSHAARMLATQGIDRVSVLPKRRERSDTAIRTPVLIASRVIIAQVPALRTLLQSVESISLRVQSAAGAHEAARCLSVPLEEALAIMEAGAGTPSLALDQAEEWSHRLCADARILAGEQHLAGLETVAAMAAAVATRQGSSEPDAESGHRAAAGLLCAACLVRVSRIIAAAEPHLAYAIDASLRAPLAHVPARASRLGPGWADCAQFLLHGDGDSVISDSGEPAPYPSPSEDLPLAALLSRGLDAVGSAWEWVGDSIDDLCLSTAPPSATTAAESAASSTR